MKPLARYAALNSYVEVAHSSKIDPATLLRASGLDPAGLSLQDRWVPAEAIADLLERSAAAADRDDFGLVLAERRRFSNLGPLSLVVREEPDVRSALRILVRYEHMYNEALHTRLTEQDGVATIRITLDVGRPGEFHQSVDLAVAVMSPSRIPHPGTAKLTTASSAPPSTSAGTSTESSSTPRIWTRPMPWRIRCCGRTRSSSSTRSEVPARPPRWTGCGS